jgi:hypothetical protein
MYKYLITSIAFIIMVVCSNHLYGQQKYEKESRLNETNVPFSALDFIDSLEIEGKIKWYLEEGINHTSIEAKFKLNKQKYSIEFDSLGNLEDIEIQIEWDELQKSLRDSISSQLSKDCIKHKIKKIQIQYSGDRSALLYKIKTGKSANNYIVRYEIIVRCKHVKNVALFEYLFSDTGQILTTSKLIFKNSNNLEY